MSERLDKTALAHKVAQRAEISDQMATATVDAVFEELYEAIKRGDQISIRNFGSFYVRPESKSWVFRFNPSQRLRAVFGWSSTYQGAI